MNAALIAKAPDRLFLPGRTDRCLLAWLHARGASLTLLELEEERQRRGMRTSTSPREEPMTKEHNRELLEALRSKGGKAPEPEAPELDAGNVSPREGTIPPNSNRPDWRRQFLADLTERH